MAITPTKSMRTKLFAVVFVLITVAALYVMGNLFNVSVVKAEYYRAKANNQQMESYTINANRGTIYDANGKILAQSKTVWNVVISPGDINDNEPENRELICSKLSEILNVDKDKLLKASEDTTSRYYMVKKAVDKDIFDKITAFKKESNISTYSVQLQEDSKRYYPNDNLASSVIGFTNYDNEGVYGVEAYYDDYLQGVEGRVITAKDAKGDVMPYDYETRYEATDGNSLMLTIDETLQYYLEKNLEKTITQQKVANRATSIIMNAKTGAILAMATAPTFNLNSPSTLSDSDKQLLAEYAETEDVTDEQVDDYEAALREKQWNNKAISELYYPGSVFKTITCASALEEQKVSLDDTFTCYGVVNVAGTDIHCWSLGGHGTLTLQEAITKSCNPAFIAIGQSLGAVLFSNYFAAFGFTEKTGIDLPGESSPLYVSRENMGIVELSSSSFGQTNKITPLQMIAAFTAVVNGGKLMTPYVVDKILDNEGNVIKTTEPTVKRQVISEETSETMREILENIVDFNGGTNAYIEGYRIGGKSGTSQKIDDYDNDNMRYVGTFCACAPANDPEIVMLVCVDEPMGDSYYGSAVAAPVVSAVFSECFDYLGIYPQYTEEELAAQAKTVPYLIGKSSMEVTTSLNTMGLKAKFVGDGDSATALYTVPSSGAAIPGGGTVVVYMSDEDYLTTTVPNVVGMTVSQANTAITDAGLNISLTGGAIENDTAKASLQSVEAGTEVNQGTVVEVTFAVDGYTG